MKIWAGIEPRTVRVLKRTSNGGGHVEFPISKAVAGVKLENTASPGQGSIDVTVAMFEEMVANFPKKPGPTLLHFGHESEDRPETKRTKTTGAAGSITALKVEGDELWARAYLTPKAFDLTVTHKNGMIGGQSIEASKGFQAATGMIPGWVLEASVLTNDPAFDVNYLAASRRQRTPRTGKERDMPATTAEKLQAEQTRLGEENTALKAENEKLTGGVEKLKAENEKLRTDVDALKTANEQTLIRSEVRDAISQGVAPAFFGEDWDSDPAKFLADRFGGSIDSMRATIAAMPKSVNVGATVTPSLHATTFGDAEAKFEAEVEKIAAEGGMIYGDAHVKAREQHPKLWAEIEKGYSQD